MAEGRGELEVYNHWFAAADLDRDGVLGGAEAVAFFQRSGLPQSPTLFKARVTWWLGTWDVKAARNGAAACKKSGWCRDGGVAWSARLGTLPPAWCLRLVQVCIHIAAT